MTAKLTGQPWYSKKGNLIDVPERMLDQGADFMVEWAQHIGGILVIPDQQVTRRLRAHCIIDPKAARVGAATNLAETLEAVIANGDDTVYIVQRMEQRQVKLWRCSALETKRRDY